MVLFYSFRILRVLLAVFKWRFWKKIGGRESDFCSAAYVNHHVYVVSGRVGCGRQRRTLVSFRWTCIAWCVVYVLEDEWNNDGYSMDGQFESKAMPCLELSSRCGAYRSCSFSFWRSCGYLYFIFSITLDYNDDGWKAFLCMGHGMMPTFGLLLLIHQMYDNKQKGRNMMMASSRMNQNNHPG